MSIPMYFAMSWETSVNHCAAHKAQLGFGFFEDGTLSVPEQLISNAPIVINDAVLPQQAAQKRAVEYLAALCTHGCFFDFERPASKWSLQLLTELQAYIGTNTLLAVPPCYAKSAPHAAVTVSVQELPNNWTQFCKKQQDAYKKWVWEVIPHRKELKLPIGTVKNKRINPANCFCNQEKDTLIYYDTMETVASKLDIAQYYGCIAGIGLSAELDAIKQA